MKKAVENARHQNDVNNKDGVYDENCCGETGNVIKAGVEEEGNERDESSG